MKYADTGFRALYNHFAVFPVAEGIRESVRDFPGADDADGVLVYGYIDHEAGLSLEVLAMGKQENGSWHFADGNDEISSIIRIGAVENEDFGLLKNADEKLGKRYARKLEMLKSYEVSEEIEKSRTFSFLDDARHPHYPDDVLVIFEKDGLEPEGCWARIIDVSERRLWAKLLNEPNQDYGLHCGEDFTFYVQEDEKTGRITCHARFSPVEKIDPDSLEDGEQLKDAVRRFHEGTDKDALFWILQILRDSCVWIPCSAIVGEEDQKTVEQMIGEAGDDLGSMVGKEFTTQGNIHLIPDIFEKDGEYFFPAFSTEEDMGEYGEGFSKIQEHFMTVLDLARTTQHEGKELTGIIINPFTAPFVLPKELYEAVEKMVSRVAEENEDN